MISLLVLLVVLGLVMYLLSTLPIPQPWRTIIYVVSVLIVIVYLLRFAGIGGV